MTMQVPAPNHGHTWEPLPRWGGRYKCSGCKCFGYSVIGAGQFGKHPGEIRPYMCEFGKGETKCHNPAVAKDTFLTRSKRSEYRTWRCPDHRWKR